eukprot:10652541-Prorocentrum_lima.AAC.1
MGCPGPTYPARRDGEVDLNLSDSRLPVSTSLLAGRGCRGLCRADGVLAIVLLPALPETFTCYSTFNLSYNPWWCGCR